MPDLEAAVTRVMQGDGSAFGTVVEATSQELVRMAARIVGSLSDAEDVVQEGYIKAYRAMMSGHFDRRSSTKTWLYRIVTRTAVDALRAKARAPVPRDALDDDAATGASPEAHLALAELADWLGVLPPEQRAAIVLHAIEGFSAREAADLLGCSEGAIEQRLVRARATLRAQRGTA